MLVIRNMSFSWAARSVSEYHSEWFRMFSLSDFMALKVTQRWSVAAEGGGGVGNDSLKSTQLWYPAEVASLSFAKRK